VERQLKEARGYSSQAWNKEDYSKGKTTSTSNAKAAASKSLPKNDVALSSNCTNSVKCFKCHGFGHIAFDCPNPKIVSLIEEELEKKKHGESTSSNKGSKERYEVIYGDQGESIIIR